MCGITLCPIACHRVWCEWPMCVCVTACIFDCATVKVDGNSSFSIGAIPQSKFSEAKEWMHDNSSALVVNNKSTGGGNKRRSDMVSRLFVLIFCVFTIGCDRLGPRWCAVLMVWLASSLLQSKGRTQLCWPFLRNSAVLFIWCQLYCLKPPHAEYVD